MSELTIENANKNNIADIINTFSALFDIAGEGILYEYNQDQLKNLVSVLSNELEEQTTDFLKKLNIFIYKDTSGILESINTFVKFITTNNDTIKTQKNKYFHSAIVNTDNEKIDIRNISPLRSKMGTIEVLENESKIEEPNIKLKYNHNGYMTKEKESK